MRLVICIQAGDEVKAEAKPRVVTKDEAKPEVSIASLLVLLVLRSWYACMLQGYGPRQWPACCCRGAGAAVKAEGNKKEEANKEGATKEKEPTPEPAMPEQPSIQLKGKLLPSGVVFAVLLCDRTLAAVCGHQACFPPALVCTALAKLLCCKGDRPALWPDEVAPRQQQHNSTPCPQLHGAKACLA